MTGTVVVVGSANVDLVVPVERHPAGGETVLGGTLTRTPGGKGANQAVASARAGGAATSMVGALGTDDAADLLLASLTGAGVDVGAVARVDLPTGTALITVDAAGENAIVVAPGANGLVRVDDAARGRLAAADVVLAQLEVPVATVVAAARARRDGASLVLNAAPSRDLPPELWREVDVLVVNEHEARDLAGQGRGVEAARLLLERVPAVVVTLGGAGAVVLRRGLPDAPVPGVPVEAVDTTGAGDTFCGVLAAGLARGDDLADAARGATVAAALAVTRHGAQDAVPTAAECAAAAARGISQDHEQETP